MKLDNLSSPAALTKAPSGIEMRLKAVQTELIAKQLEKTLLARTTASPKAVILHGNVRMRELRGGDAPKLK
jgi:circadian clock protein KaiC